MIYDTQKHSILHLSRVKTGVIPENENFKTRKKRPLKWISVPKILELSDAILWSAIVLNRVSLEIRN